MGWWFEQSYNIALGIVLAIAGAALLGLVNHVGKQMPPRGPYWNRVRAGVRRAPVAASFVAIVVVLCLGVVGIRLAIGDPAEETASSPGPETEAENTTEVHTYLPSDADVENATELDPNGMFAWCATRSFSSARTDAYACLLGGNLGIVHDPCFDVAENKIVCPRPPEVLAESEGDGVVAEVTESADVDWMSLEGRVGVERADQTVYPWAFAIDLHDDEGSPFFCEAALSASGSYEDTTFNCSASGVSAVYVGMGWDDFVSGKNWLEIAVPGIITASSFERERQPWTVMVHNPDSNRLERVPILEAWF